MAKTEKKKDDTTEAASRKKRKHVSPLTQELEEKPKSKKEQQKSKRALKEEEEERRLTALIFGGGSDGGAFGDIVEEEEEDDDLKHDDYKRSIHQNYDDVEASSLSFEIDRTGKEVGIYDEIEAALAKPDDGEQDIIGLLDGLSANDNDDDDNNKPRSKLEEELEDAWYDPDDDNVQVDLMGVDRLKKLRKHKGERGILTGTEFQKRLRDRFENTMQLTAHTEWANLANYTAASDDDNKDTAAALLSSSQPLLRQNQESNARLPPNILTAIRCPDANQSDYNQSVVEAVHFHPGSEPDKPLLLTGGLDKTLRFFQVGIKSSKKLHGLHFPDMPIRSAYFLGSTGKVVVSGRRPFYYLYDSIGGNLDKVQRILGREEKSWEKCVPSPDGKMIAFVGNDGYIILVDAHTKNMIASLKMNGSCRAISFTPDGEHILASGSDGDIYRWDINSRRCLERFSNQDGTITSSLAVSPRRRQVAVGSESGVVNLYSDEVIRRQGRSVVTTTTARTPIKSIMNLQTSADLVRYNHDGQILAMSSRRERQALKLLHVPTSTVFSNWPTSKTPLNYVWSMDFSPESKFMAVGNDKGKCLLYRLQHYIQS